jgi:dienelactone hydrolase
MRLSILFLALMVASSAQAQTVTVPSAVYADFRQLLARESPTSSAGVGMTLRFPEERRGRHPAIVIVHTIGGYQEANEGWHAQAFRRQGFATLTYPSMAVSRLREGGSPAAAWPSAVAEAYAAFRMLADHPEIDAGRIAIVGFSFGGEVAYLAALEPLRAALVPGKAGFAAHVAYYPAGVHAAEPGTYTGAPILMLLGGKDDNLPVAKAQDYLAYARQAGQKLPIDVMTYPGAYHAWTVPGVGAVRFHPQYESTRKCPYVLIGPSGPALLVDGRPAPLPPTGLRDCVREGRGYTMAYDEAERSKALSDTLAFLRRVLMP